MSISYCAIRNFDYHCFIHTPSLLLTTERKIGDLKNNER